MNEETLFQEALSRSPEERGAFLDQACTGRPELRAAVEALLAAHEMSGHVLDSPPGEIEQTVDSQHESEEHAATAAHPATGDLKTQYPRQSKAGLVIAGRYTLVETIGEGGMGEVWIAEQSEPVKRNVALKLIKAGMDSRAVLQRFEQERQALALMDHPNIARVLDGGATPTGQPFFVMELVDGLPLNQFCDEDRLTPAQRLELFVPICQAVQHAHQKGVVHRDLKPANILVTLVDGKPVPKVIDFGVAKAISGKITEETLSTGFGAVVGTLEYMAPEQAGFSNDDIDTRADIYSLGVILYELLTGLRPIDRQRLKSAAITEMIRIIREEEPSKPSTRLSTNESLSSLAAARGTDPSKLTTALRGELDWVVMKCLEKQRDRRYETVNGLARDIQRYLNSEPVEARPQSAGYRLKKFVQRNRTKVVAAGLVLLTMVAGIIGTTWGLLDADRQRQKAERAATQAKEQRARAESRELLAIDAVKQFRDAVVDEPELKNNPGLEELRERLLQEPLEFFRDLNSRLQSDGDTLPESLARLADASFQLGELTDEIGDKQDAITAYRASQATYQRLVDDDPDDVKSQSLLARCRHKLGFLLMGVGENKAAQEELLQAKNLRQKLADDHPANDDYQHDLALSHAGIATLLREEGDLGKAMAALEAAREILEPIVDSDNPVAEHELTLANCYSIIGTVASETGQEDQALQAARSTLSIYTKLVTAHPDVTKYRRLQAGARGNLAMQLYAHGRATEAVNAQRLAVGTQKKVVEEQPTVTEYRYLLAGLQANLSSLLYAVGEMDEAQQSEQAAIETSQRLADANPTVTRFQSRLASLHHNRGLSLVDSGKINEGIKSVELAEAIHQRLVDHNPTIPKHQTALARIRQTIAQMLMESGESDKSIEMLDSAVEIQQTMVNAHPKVPEYKLDLASQLNMKGMMLESLGRQDDALQTLNEASVILQKLTDEHPTVTDYMKFRAENLNLAGSLLARIGLPSEARESHRSALDIYKKLAKDHPRFHNFANSLGGTLNQLAIIDIATNQLEEARDLLLEARKWQRKALDADPTNPLYRQFMRNHLSNLIKAAQGLGDEETVAEARRELEML